MSTGFPDADARSDFDRERRRRALANIAARLRSEPDDVSEMLPFEEVVGALGRGGEHDLGVQVIPLESIVGTVDRSKRDFDRKFRPATPGVRERWERIAAARRRGDAMPPIDVYRVGDLHFVKDGHHRVSVARALGDTDIEARVRAVDTAVGAGPGAARGPAPAQAPRARVPRARAAAAGGARADQARRRVEVRPARQPDRGLGLPGEPSPGTADGPPRDGRDAGSARSTSRWSRFLEEAGIGGGGTETERYLRIAMIRYLLLHTHDWTDEVIERLLGDLRPASADDDTMVHQILKEME